MSPAKAAVLSVLGKIFICVTVLLSGRYHAYAQMREVSSNPLAMMGPVKKIDFVSPKEGYVAFSEGIGFTTDTAHSFKSFTYITTANDDLIYWGISSGSKFSVNGLKAFDLNNILVYGSYPAVPAILKSTDGGKTFTIVLATVDRSGGPARSGVTDMVNLKERNITLAVDDDHVYRSASNGFTWDTLQVIADAHFTNIDGYENGHVYAWSTTHPQQYIYRSGTDGSGFAPITVRGGTLRAASFISASEGYICVNGIAGPEVYQTVDAGETWMHTLLPGQTAIPFNQLKFVDAATGYGIANRNDTYQTIDSGHSWQKIPRTSYGGAPPQDFYLSTLSTFDGNQLWTGGENSLIELNTGMSKTPPPSAPANPISLFSIDTTGLSAGQMVKLYSLSEPGLTFQWFVNNQLIGTGGMATFAPAIGKPSDTISLVVFRGVLSDTSIQYQHYPVVTPPIDPPPVDPPPVDPPPSMPTINLAAPLVAPAGGTVEITGTNFKDVISVSFGGVPAASFVMMSESLISAVVGQGGTGTIEIKTTTGTATLNGFVFISKPVLISYTPGNAAIEEIVIIRGNNLSPTTQVFFGTVPAARFAIISDNEIHAVMGNGSSGYLKIITIAGEDSLAGFRFTPVPDIFSVTPDRGIAGTQVTIRGEHFTGATGVSVGSNPVSSFSVLSDSVIIAVVAQGTDGYIRITSNYGNSGPGPYYRYSTVPVIHSFTPILGGEGTRMKIYIDRNYEIDTVKIGGVPVRERIPSFYEYLDVIVGKGATGKISLQTPDTTIFSSDSFEYVEKPILKSFTPATGKAGTIVTITGVNIHRSSKIYFGDAMASRVTVLSDSVLTAVVGSGASGEVKLETAGGRMSLPGFIFIPSSILILKSFFPVSGKAGTIIEIAGENFSSDPGLNFVGFGAAFGKVISASPSLLKVEVPYGASAELLTVSCNGFTATSNNFFTLQGSIGRQLSDTTYKAVNTVIKAKLFPGTNMEADDLDGDGKPDLVVTTELNKYKVYRNASSQDSVSFEEALSIEDVSLFQNIIVADIDGDGRPELVTGEPSVIKIFKNTSIIGKISFDAPTERIGGSYSFFRVADINADGKPEILGLSDQGEVIIFRNTSSGSTISFGSRYIFPKGKTTSQFEVGDLDGDGKPEVISAISRSDLPEKSLLIFQNTSTTDTISFGSPSNFNGGDNPQKFILGDINRDNKTDLIINYNNGIQYVENTTINSAISFAPVTNIMTSSWTTTSDIGDLNGDGLVDLVCDDTRDSILHIYVQKLVNKVVSFVEVAQTKTNNGLNDISIRDLNKNGSPEILFIGDDEQLHLFSADLFLPPADTCSIIANISMSRDSLCKGNQLVFTAAGSGTFSNASYQWLINGNPQILTGSTFKDPMLKAGDKVSVVMKGNTSCGLEMDTSNVISLTSVGFARHAVSITATLINQCDPFTRTFSAGQITFVNPGASNNGQVIDPKSGSYRWKVNGRPAGSGIGVLAVTNLKAGDIVWLEYLLSTPCETDTIISNKIAVTFNDRIKPTAKITGDTKIKQGETATMKVEVTNPTKTISYQWQDSTSDHSWRLMTGATLQLLMYQPASNGDKLRNIIISIDSCNYADTIVTNTVAFEITDSPVPLANLPIRAFPNPVGSTLSLDNINPADNWQSLELLGADGHKFIIMKDIQNRTSINLSLVHVPRGLYFVVFKRSTGESSYLRILKQ